MGRYHPLVMNRARRSQGRRALRNDMALLLGIVTLLAAHGIGGAVEWNDPATALRFQPPLAASSVNPGTLDGSLVPHLLVRVTRVATGATLTEFDAASPLPSTLGISSSGYRTLWKVAGAVFGDQVRFAVLVKGLTRGGVTLAPLAVGSITALVGRTKGELSINGNQTVPVIFALDPHPMIRARQLDRAGQSATQIAAVLRSEFGLPAVQSATLLKGEAFTALDIGGALKEVYRLTAQGMAEVLKALGYTAGETAQALQSDYQQTAGEAAQALKAVGYPVKEIAAALLSVYQLTAGDTAGVLKALGYGVAEVLETLKTVFGESDLEAAGLLKGAGYTAIEIAGALKAVSLLEAFDTAAILKGVGFAVVPLTEAIRGTFSVLASGMAPLLKGIGYNAVEVLPTLKSVYSESDQSVSGFLKLAGFTAKEIAGALKTSSGLGLVGTTTILKNVQFDVTLVAVAVNEVYSVDDLIRLARTLKTIGYDEISAAKGLDAVPDKELRTKYERERDRMSALAQAFERGQVAHVARDFYFRTGAEAAVIFYAIGYATGDLVFMLGGFYGMTASAIALALNYVCRPVAPDIPPKEECVPVLEVLDALVEVMQVTIETAVEAVKTAGYALEEIAGALKDAFGLGEEAVKDVLQAAGFALDDILDIIGDIF